MNRVLQLYRMLHIKCHQCKFYSSNDIKYIIQLLLTNNNHLGKGRYFQQELCMKSYCKNCKQMQLSNKLNNDNCKFHKAILWDQSQNTHLYIYIFLHLIDDLLLRNMLYNQYQHSQKYIENKLDGKNYKFKHLTNNIDPNKNNKVWMQLIV